MYLYIHICLMHIQYNDILILDTLFQGMTSLSSPGPPQEDLRGQTLVVAVTRFDRSFNRSHSAISDHEIKV